MMFTTPKIAFLAASIALFLPSACALDFSSARWIWTNELSGGNAPVGHRAFRKDLLTTPAQGKIPSRAEILMTVDNGYRLYVNGVQLGSTYDDWTVAQRFCTPLDPHTNIIAVDTVNDGTSVNPAGILAAIQITYTDGTTATLGSDSTWKYSFVVPANFQQPTFDDSTWSAAVAEGSYGVSPWGAITIPAAITC